MKDRNVKKKKIPRNILIFLGIPVVLIFLVGIITNFLPRESHKYSDILNHFKKMEVVEYNMNMGSGDMEIKLNNGKVVRYSTPNVGLMYSDIKEHVEKYNQEHPGAPIVYNLTKAAETSWLINAFTFVILPMLIIGLMGWHLLRKITVIGGDASRPFSFSKAKPEENSLRKTTFESVAGADEEKEELAEIVDFLKNPKKYRDMGARIPKGVLLVGPPGTGKTLLARAVAGEAGVPFFAMSGSDFVEMFVGVGASRVRDLFRRAKENEPCIIFIDEMDAVGRCRGAGLGGGHDEREQTLNQLLVEMDGFGTKNTVIVIAATNRVDILDPAIIRPGRIDREIIMRYPDARARKAILRLHAKGKPFSSEVNLHSIAMLTAGLTGAELENILNESAILAVKLGKSEITNAMIEESMTRIVMGSQKKSRILSEKEKKITAFHEAGHAIVGYYCETQDQIFRISIIPRGSAGGYTMTIPDGDNMYVSRKEMNKKICFMLGGRAAEALALGEDDISTGASNDIQKATKTARNMATKYGMSDLLGPVDLSNSSSNVFIAKDIGGGHSKVYSEETLSKIDFEVREKIQKCYNEAKKILESNFGKLNELANYLMINESIGSEQFADLMKR
ncbi:MAG: ATP-dependent zinc metalloprotease FtsH [Candidatus Improbicoccus pseudotrichonymphae]|uniref:ATP-dependent zinc metalloprotease FtsH n=1 Tax=Candidatus Improbicoccus pseudotrichonymphae TaxID=3033792 RepID=A0AA48HYJ8_9FIRM|nr:MAG: ATP-dependent zinc metalloprotease FtsH [Candidatus Improbicoccus pseudotrichonymphae]